MKLICPPANWQNPIEIDEKSLNVVYEIAQRLGMVYGTDAQSGKVYLGLPAVVEGASFSKEAAPAEKTDGVLRFYLRLPKDPWPTIIDGVIMLNNEMYKATSGCIGGQVYGSYWVLAQSPIPPGKSYKVDLQWTESPLAGIGGRFYHILPDPILNSDGSGRRRTEIGLHKDAGTPGTSGCIGVVGKDWDRLRDQLDRLARSQRYAKLEVTYLCRD